MIFARVAPSRRLSLLEAIPSVEAPAKIDRYPILEELGRSGRRDEHAGTGAVGSVSTPAHIDDDGASAATGDGSCTDELSTPELAEQLKAYGNERLTARNSAGALDCFAMALELLDEELGSECEPQLRAELHAYSALACRMLRDRHKVTYHADAALGFDPAQPALLHAAGFSGHGAMLGPFTASAIAQMAVCRETLPSIDLDGAEIDLRPLLIGRKHHPSEGMVI